MAFMIERDNANHRLIQQHIDKLCSDAGMCMYAETTDVPIWTQFDELKSLLCRKYKKTIKTIIEELAKDD
jgi:hypothetical protein